MQIKLNIILGGLVKISIGLNHAKIKKPESVFSEMTKGKAKYSLQNSIY